MPDDMNDIKKINYRDLPDPPSDDFMECIVGGGSVEQECGFCGRIHVALGDRSYLEDEDVKRYEDEAKNDPDRYVLEYNYDSISFGEFDGQTFVWGCPCNRLSRYEDFIWVHRNQIIEYLKKKTKRELEEAHQEAAMVASIDEGKCTDVQKALDERTREIFSWRT